MMGTSQLVLKKPHIGHIDAVSRDIHLINLASKIEVVYHNRFGQPPLPTRLLVGLHYLKALFKESDENVVERWVENPYWQCFCGFEYLQHELPLHPTSLVKWHQRVDGGFESLSAETIELARSTKLMSARSLDHVNVDWDARKSDCLSNRCTTVSIDTI